MGYVSGMAAYPMGEAFALLRGGRVGGDGWPGGADGTEQGGAGQAERGCGAEQGRLGAWRSGRTSPGERARFVSPASLASLASPFSQGGRNRCQERGEDDSARGPASEQRWPLLQVGLQRRGAAAQP